MVCFFIGVEARASATSKWKLITPSLSEDNEMRIRDFFQVSLGSPMLETLKLSSYIEDACDLSTKESKFIKDNRGYDIQVIESNNLERIRASLRQEAYHPLHKFDNFYLPDIIESWVTSGYSPETIKYLLYLVKTESFDFLVSHRAFSVPAGIVEEYDNLLEVSDDINNIALKTNKLLNDLSNKEDLNDIIDSPTRELRYIFVRS